MHVSSGHPGARNDKTIVKTDMFVQQMKEKEILHDVEFTLFRKDGTSFTARGAYLITDNGYARWRMMQCPIKSSFTMDELMWSTRLESVRKDIECTFGILKVRFRILSGNVLFQKQKYVDNVFVASCIIHNMNLEEDELDLQWKNPANWERSEYGDDTDLRDGRNLSLAREVREKSRVQGRMIVRDAIVQDTPLEKERSIIVENDDEADDDYYVFRSQLVDHYIYCKEILHNIEWTF